MSWKEVKIEENHWMSGVNRTWEPEPTEKSHPDASEGCQYDGHSEECSSDTGTKTKTDSIMHHMFYQKKLYGIH